MIRVFLKIGIGLAVFLAAMSYSLTGETSQTGIKQVPPLAVLIFLAAFAVTEFVFLQRRKRQEGEPQ